MKVISGDLQKLQPFYLLFSSFLPIYTMFGWRDYREDGKQWVENGVENSVFHCLGSEGKKRGRKTQKKIFLLGPPIFFLPNREENCGEKAFSLCNYWTALSQCLQIHLQHTYIHQQYIHIKPRKSTARPYSSNPYTNSYK